jgi:hypothetical protein
MIHREVLFRAQRRVPQGVKVGHRFDAFLDLERFAGVKPCEQCLQLVQERLGLFGGQFVAVDFQRERLTKEATGLIS